MAVSVLVMTPVRSFGELIQQALQETGLYRVALVRDSDQVVEHVRTKGYPVAVLDFDLDSNPSDLVEAVYGLDANLRIVAIKDETDSDTSVLEGARLAQHLDTLFYLPDLLDALDVVTADLQHITSQSVRNGPAGVFPSTILENKKFFTRQESPEWLEDVELAAIHLTRLSLESAAQAALITRNAQLWAYAGHLPHPAAEELAQFVGHYWTRDGSSDFARFIRLDAVSGEYILYATGLGGDYVLALAFDTEIPFSKIRSQANGLARKLANAPQETSPIEEVADSPLVDAQSEAHDVTAPIAPSEILDFDEELIEFPADWRPDQEIAEGRQAFFEDLLSSVDIPDPDGRPTPSNNLDDDSIINLDDADHPNNQDGATLDVSTQKMGPQGKLKNTFAKNENPDTMTGDSLKEGGSDVQGDSRGSVHPSIIEREQFEAGALDGSVPHYLMETLATPIPDYQMDTIPTPTRGSGEKFHAGQIPDGKFQPLNSVYPELTYACVLVPKLSQHLLIGDLAAFLNRCVVQVGKAFGWQLEHLAIRPSYLHWVTALPPGTSPGHMVRIMRDHASHRVFTQFPRLAHENPSGDFWASGYLIVNGKFPLSHQLVDDFINKTRVRQGQPHNHSLD